MKFAFFLTRSSTYVRPVVAAFKQYLYSGRPRGFGLHQGQPACFISSNARGLLNVRDRWGGGKGKC